MSAPADPAATTESATAAVNLLYDDTAAGVNHQEVCEAVIFPLAVVLDPASVREVDQDERDFLSSAPDGASYVLPEAKIDTKGFWSSLESDRKSFSPGPVT